MRYYFIKRRVVSIKYYFLSGSIFVSIIDLRVTWSHLAYNLYRFIITKIHTHKYTTLHRYTWNNSSMKYTDCYAKLPFWKSEKHHLGLCLVLVNIRLPL